MNRGLDFLLVVDPATVAPLRQQEGGRRGRHRFGRWVRVPDERSSEPTRSLGDRLNQLVATVHPPERGPYTDEEVVDGIRSVGGPSLSAQYFNHLRHGRRDNPTKAALEGIARFFRVPVGYLFADEFGESDDADRHILTVVRRAKLEELVELIGELPEETKDSVERIVEDLHRLHSSGRRPRRG